MRIFFVAILMFGLSACVPEEGDPPGNDQRIEATPSNSDGAEELTPPEPDPTEVDTKAATARLVLDPASVLADFHGKQILDFDSVCSVPNLVGFDEESDKQKLERLKASIRALDYEITYPHYRDERDHCLDSLEASMSKPPTCETYNEVEFDDVTVQVSTMIPNGLDKSDCYNGVILLTIVDGEKPLFVDAYHMSAMSIISGELTPEYVSENIMRLISVRAIPQEDFANYKPGADMWEDANMSSQYPTETFDLLMSKATLLICYFTYYEGFRCAAINLVDGYGSSILGGGQ